MTEQEYAIFRQRVHVSKMCRILPGLRKLEEALNQRLNVERKELPEDILTDAFHLLTPSILSKMIDSDHYDAVLRKIDTVITWIENN